VKAGLSCRSRDLHQEAFSRILNWANENLTREEVNKLFLATDNEGRGVFHVDAWIYYQEAFPRILNCAKENLTREEVNSF
jgi:endo-1,4-beta-D-glucanase Y